MNRRFYKFRWFFRDLFKKLNKNGLPGVITNIQVTQLEHSLIVLSAIKKYLGFGNLRYVSATRAWVFYARALSDINKFNTIIKENDVYFKGAKALDYQNFQECIQLINNKENLTAEGYQKILTITKNMNANRIFREESDI